MALNIAVYASGPIFNGRLEQAIADGLADGEQELVLRGWVDVRTQLNLVLQHQTPFYRDQIMMVSNRITDNDVIYGPWLEGTGSRNFPKTRFRGYGTFRKVAQRLNAEAQGVIERAINRRIGAL
jgi:hypothetical protein